MPKRRKKAKGVRPDEVFAHGPLRMARYGRHVTWQTHWPEGEFDKMQARAVEHHPRVTAEIGEIVAAIAVLVPQLKPERVLLRAWWEMAMRHIKVEAESDLDFDDALAVRMIDYVQSVIASVPPTEQQREPSEDDWAALKAKVEALFRDLNFDYQICSTAARRGQPGFDVDFEEFRFKAQLYWVNVRGHRYQVHDPVFLSEVFPQHSDVLQELFGLTGEQFVDGLTALWRNLSFGLRDSFEALESFRKDTLDAVDRKLSKLPPGDERDLKELINEVVEENGWEERRARVFNGMFGLDLFDLRRVTKFPDKLLDELSWGPGQELEFFSDGDRKGWPLRVWPIVRRPFIKISGSYYCFDLYSLFDNIYRVMQRTILRLKPNYADRWKLEQTALSENLPVAYFRRLLPAAQVWQSVFYQGVVDNGKVDWCESDALIAYEDHLFIVECRGGAFTHTSPASDFDAYVASLRNLVLKPATQGRRFLTYLEGKETVAIFDRDKKQIGELRRADYRHVTICPVSLDPFTEIAAQVQHLKKIGVDVGVRPVWAISLDDLRVYADIFTNPLIFLHYVEKRLEAFGSTLLESNDEFDHVGLYLKHNNYVVYTEELRGGIFDKVLFDGYRTDIDKFFCQRMFDPAFPCPLKQDSHGRFFEIIDYLAVHPVPGRARAASYLLNFAGDTRDNISRSIDEELARQPETKRPMPLSAHGVASVTIYCWSPDSGPRDTAAALSHTRSVLLATGEQSKLLLELQYDAARELGGVWWAWVDRAEIPPEQLPKVERDAEKIRQKRIARARAKAKIGRNDLCPCASGRKYKKCCLPLERVR